MLIERKNVQINTQRAILASFLWCNDLGMPTKEAFLLNVDAFTDDRRLIASKINEVTTTKDRHYSILNMELENTSQQEWLKISEQTALPFAYAKKMHNTLTDNRKEMI